MRKVFLFLGLFCLFLTGCGKQNEGAVLKEFQDKVNSADAYYLTGNMELVNNEDVYSYKINVAYERDDHYKIELINLVNDHEQVILRNEEGVYIITPSLNKSFKFQSDWPYNNSQVYLLSSLMDDLSNDGNRTFEKVDDGYIFTSSVNYPNNEKLVSQKIYLGNDYLPTKVVVMDADGNPQITMVFDKIDLKIDFNDTYFDLGSVINTDKKEEKKEEKDTSETQEPNEDGTKTKETATIDDIIYPMYLPVNTYLTNQERVSTDDGERMILTFSGDSAFTLIEETVSYSDKAEIIPTYGTVELVGASLAVVNDNSANWFDNGIEYYLVSDVMTTDELLQVVRSISVLPVSK